jgi:hypothetical protein
MAEIIFPEYDEVNMRPSAKMPDCPNCNQDELGMLTSEKVFCYFCSSTWLKENGTWVFYGIRDPKLFFFDENNVPMSLNDALSECDGSSAYSNDRERPYDGQPHTDYGERGRTEIKGITFRDLRDCFIKGCLLACGDKQPALYARVEDGNWLPEDIYKINFNEVDPVAIAQNMSVEVEKMMGIYPNVPPLIFDTK